MRIKYYRSGYQGTAACSDSLDYDPEEMHYKYHMMLQKAKQRICLLEASQNYGLRSTGQLVFRVVGDVGSIPALWLLGNFGSDNFRDPAALFLLSRLDSMNVTAASSLSRQYL